MAGFRPLLAATIEDGGDLEKLNYPLIASPKVDGIRIVCHPTMGPVTRSLKPLRNKHAWSILKEPVYAGFDGEIVVGPITAPDVFQRTTSGVMTMDGTPSFTYWVFDDCTDSFMPYNRRHRQLQDRVQETWKSIATEIQVLPWLMVHNPAEVLQAEIMCLSQGFEGIMLRSRNGVYKWGRSTLKEQTLMKLKRFKDGEAVIIGFEPLQRNQNPQTRDERGYAHRSDHKEGKVQVETLGNLLVRSDEFGEFAIGSGFDASTREAIWLGRDSYLGSRVTFKFQPIGIKDKPRFPIFKGFRPAE